MIKEKLIENFGHPRGLLGRLAGWIMAKKKSNTARGRWAIAELAPKRDDRVLEIGYGPGLGLADMSRRVSEGTVIGVDISDVMLGQARRRNAEAIRSGRLELRVGDAQALDPDLSEFDLVYGINVWQFWIDQAATIAALHERLAPGGRLALVYMRPPSGTTTGEQAAQLLQEQFTSAGLVDIEVRTMRFDPPAVMVLGHRG
jgi:SAM-dependent methyltransferase